MREIPVALSIAGSDSGGGAGIQADMRVMHRLGVFATTSITAVTAQNLAGVARVVALDAAMVRAQIDAVTSGFAVAAAKTGMLATREVVETIAEVAGELTCPLVVDPVMIATSGARLLDRQAEDAYRSRLLPRAALVTPNLDEAAALLEREPIAPDEMQQVAETIYARFGCPVLLKGGHLSGDPVDVLRHPDGVVSWRHARIPDVDTHGSGCMLSAAIASHLALGHALVEACERALAFVHDALQHSHQLRTGDERFALAGVEKARSHLAHLQRL